MRSISFFEIFYHSPYVLASLTPYRPSFPIVEVINEQPLVRNKTESSEIKIYLVSTHTLRL